LSLKKLAAQSVFSLLLLSFCFLGTSGSSRALSLRAVNDSDSGVVVAVYDGDTIRVQFSDSTLKLVRLIGVDTPELGDPRQEVAFFGHMAKRFAFFYLYGKTVRLTYDQTRLDKYGRTLAYVWTDKEKLFNLFIIREGFGYAFFAFPFRSDFLTRFREAQVEARQEKKGLWREGEPEVISSIQARSYLGKYISVKFNCSSLEEGRSFVYLSSNDGKFEALIPRNRKRAFPALKDFLGKSLIVTGFLEDFKGRPQIMLFFPQQLHLGASQN
jgi:micrococcal nuclease